MHACACAENGHNMACPKMSKIFIFKIRNANLGGVA